METFLISQAVGNTQVLRIDKNERVQLSFCDQPHQITVYDWTLSSGCPHSSLQSLDSSPALTLYLNTIKSLHQLEMNSSVGNVLTNKRKNLLIHEKNQLLWDNVWCENCWSLQSFLCLFHHYQYYGTTKMYIYWHWKNSESAGFSRQSDLVSSKQ